jgi:archaeal flagellin FlaB
MLKAFARILKGNQKGITGLETAIILIAFVVVAAVFSYAILSAGLYSSQKSQESVYKGLKQAEGATIIKGGVIAVAEHTGMNGYISQLTFTLSCAMAGNPVDYTEPLTTGHDGKVPANSLNMVVFSYIDGHQKVDDVFWTMTPLGYSNGDNILDEGEMFQITLGADASFADSGAGSGNLVDALTTHLGPNTTFTIDVKTPTGSTLTIERKTPAFIDRTMNLN